MKTSNSKQPSLLDNLDQDVVEQMSNTDPATIVMKKVAELAYDEKRVKKDFAPADVEEIKMKREAGMDLTKTENGILRKEYLKMKRWAVEKEKTNNQQIICVPSIVDNRGFYKLFEFSALYYAYRLADRMRRTAHIVADTDKACKVRNVVSITNMPKFVEQITDILNPTVEVAEGGIYIFTMQKPLTDDEIGQLRMTEQTRRDNLHNILRPVNMDPATHNQLLMVVRQVSPKVRKLDKQNYYFYGEQILRDLNTTLEIYFNFADGLIDKQEAGVAILKNINNMLSALSILSENRAWDFSAMAAVGENISQLKRLVSKDFGVK